MVTVVILSQNPPQRLFDDLAAQTSQNFEIIVAKEKGIVNAMNKALRRANGEIFVRIDDDVSLPPTWLESIVAPFANASVAGVTGPTIVPGSLRDNRDSIRIAQNPNWFFRWLFDNDPFACAKIYKCGSVSYGSNFQTYSKSDYCDHLEGTNWAMRTNLIRQVGGFDPAFDGVAEWYDTDVEQKIKKLGGGRDFVYQSSALLYHNVGKGAHFNERFDGFGRIKNWIRFHRRHSKFHWKMVIWFLMMCGYFLLKSIRRN